MTQTCKSYCGGVGCIGSNLKHRCAQCGVLLCGGFCSKKIEKRYYCPDHFLDLEIKRQWRDLEKEMEGLTLTMPDRVSEKRRDKSPVAFIIIGLILFFFSISSAMGQTVNTTKNLVAYWNMDGPYTTNSRMINLIKGGENLTINGTVDLNQTGQINFSTGYTPTESLSGYRSYDVRRNFTIISWIHLDLSGADRVFLDLRSPYPASTAGSMVFFTDTARKVSVYSPTAGIDSVFLASSSAIALDTWYMVVFRRENSNISLDFNNNVRQGTYTVGGTEFVNMSGNIRIGARYDDAAGWNGFIDDVCIWNDRRLNDSEIAAIYGNQSCLVVPPPPPPPAAVAILSFNATTLSNVSIKLDWAINNTWTNLSLFRGNVSIFETSNITRTNYNDTGLVANSTYLYTLYVSGTINTESASASASTLPNTLTQELYLLISINDNLTNIAGVLSMIGLYILAALLITAWALSKDKIIGVISTIPGFIIGIDYLTDLANWPYGLVFIVGMGVFLVYVIMHTPPQDGTKENPKDLYGNMRY